MPASRDKGMAEVEAIDLFLYAAAHGLFEMNWMLLCSQCGCATESFSTMNRLHDHPHCNLCQVDLEAKLDDYIRRDLHHLAAGPYDQIPSGPKSFRRKNTASSTTSRRRARAPTGASSAR